MQLATVMIWASIHLLAALIAESSLMVQERRLRERRQQAEEGRLEDEEEEEESPFAAISATMGWETFHMVQALWLNAVDLPPNSQDKDWNLQARISPLTNTKFGVSLHCLMLASLQPHQNLAKIY